MRRGGIGGAAILAAAAALLGLGCVAPTEPLPRDERRPPPADGEIAVYDVTARDGTLLGRTATGFRVRGEERDLLRGPAAAVLESLSGGGGAPRLDGPELDGPRLDGEVTLDAEGPLRAWRGSGDRRVSSTWDRARGVVRVSARGAEATVVVPSGARDNDELLEAVRGAALDRWTARRIALFNAPLGAWIPAEVARVGEVEIATPLGTHRATDVRLGFGTTYHHVFVEVAPPHRILRYDNQGGTRLVLRSYRSSRADPAPVETGVPPPPDPRPRVPLLVAVALAQWPLMLGLPLFLAFRLKKRLALPWSVWGLGALGFVLSQVVHLPLNWALGLMGAPRALGMASPPVVALALGATAGLSEELVRWAILRRILARGGSAARAGLFAGAGHGGIEALILGGLAASTTVSLLLLQVIPPGWIGVPPDQVGEVAKQAAVYWATPFWEPIAGGVERVSAMTFHVAMSVLVAWGIHARRAAFAVALAVLAHTVLDAGAVYLTPRIGLFAIEALLLAMAVVLAVLVGRHLRAHPS